MSSGARESRREFLKLTALGAAGALAAPSIARAAPKSLTMMHESSFIPPFDAYFKGQGIVLAIATTAFVLAAAMDESQHSPAARLFSAAPLRSLGTVSLTLYVWHLPVFWFVSRHTATWSNLSRTAVTLVALTVLVITLHRFVDEPLRRWTGRIGRARPAVKTEA